MELLQMVLPEYINFYVDGLNLAIPTDRIIYLQSFGNYMKVITHEKTLTTKTTTHDMESALPDELFIRVHKSFIVNISKIEKVGEDEITLINKSKLPIGKTFKRYVKKALKE